MWSIYSSLVSTGLFNGIRCLLGVTNCQSIQLKLLFIYCRNKDYSLLKYYTFSCRIVGQFMFGLHLSFVHFTFKKPVIHRIWYPYSWRALGNCKCTRDFKRGQAIKVDAAADTVEHLEREDGMIENPTLVDLPPSFENSLYSIYMVDFYLVTFYSLTLQ